MTIRPLLLASVAAAPLDVLAAGPAQLVSEKITHHPSNRCPRTLSFQFKVRA